MGNFLLTQIWDMNGSETRWHLCAERETIIRRWQHHSYTRCKTFYSHSSSSLPLLLFRNSWAPLCGKLWSCLLCSKDEQLLRHCITWGRWQAYKLNHYINAHCLRCIFFPMSILNLRGVKCNRKLHYLAHPARRTLTRVWVVMCAPTSITWPCSHLVRAPFTLLANSSVGEGMRKKKSASKTTLWCNFFSWLSQLKVS